MKNCLVTGADGFIGSHLTENLVKHGYKVKALCQYNSFGNRGWLEETRSEIAEEIEFVMGDVRDSDQMMNECKGVDHVFHLAALIAIPYSYEAAQSYIDTNITGTHNILKACRANNVEKMIHTSSSECYGTAKYVPMDEDHPVCGQSPYAATKIAADQLCISYNRSFKQNVSIIRPFNTYGPRQSGRAVIPTIICQALEGKKEIELGSLTPTRDFNYVEDTCDAFRNVALSEECEGKIINACSSFEISIEETARLICDIIDKDIKILSKSKRMRPENSEVNRLYGENKLIKTLTGWSPKYAGYEGFRRGLEKTIEWFDTETNRIGYKATLYNK